MDEHVSISIGELADMLGVSSSSIRQYERYGILQPLRSADSGYRKFDLTEIQKLTFCRKSRKYGVSMRDLETIINEGDFQPSIRIFEARSREIDREIDRLLSAKRCIFQELVLLYLARASQDQVWEEPMEGIYHLDFLEAFRNGRQTLFSWLDNPSRCITLIHPLDGDPPLSCVSVKEGDLGETPLPKTPYIHDPPRNYLCSIRHMLRKDSARAMEGFIREARAQGRRPAGDPFLHIFSGTAGEGGRGFYCKIYLPIGQ